MDHAHRTISVNQPNIHTHAALAVVQAALAHAEALDKAVSIAVVDASGRRTAFACLPGSPLHCCDIAKDKAYTAVGFGLATAEWAPAWKTRFSDAVREGLTQRPRFIAFGGGLPIMFENARIGAVGVSGATEEEDEAIARAGLQAITP